MKTELTSYLQWLEVRRRWRCIVELYRQLTRLVIFLKGRQHVRCHSYHIIDIYSPSCKLAEIPNTKVHSKVCLPADLKVSCLYNGNFGCSLGSLFKIVLQRRDEFVTLFSRTSYLQSVRPLRTVHQLYTATVSQQTTTTASMGACLRNQVATGIIPDRMERNVICCDSRGNC